MDNNAGARWRRDHNKGADMKTKRVAILTLALTLVTTLATAAPLGYGDTPLEACENSFKLQFVLRMLARADFDLTEIQEQPIAYLVQPEGDYDWGSVVFTMIDGKQLCQVTAQVTSYQGTGYKVDRIRVEFF